MLLYPLIGTLSKTMDGAQMVIYLLRTMNSEMLRHALSSPGLSKAYNLRIIGVKVRADKVRFGILTRFPRQNRLYTTDKSTRIRNQSVPIVSIRHPYHADVSIFR